MLVASCPLLRLAVATNSGRSVPPVCEQKFSHISLESLRAEQASIVQESGSSEYLMPSSLALGLVGEVGELCANLQWKGQAEAQPGLPGWGDSQKEALADELANVLSYTVRLADVCDIDLAAAFQRNLDRNRGTSTSNPNAASGGTVSSPPQTPYVAPPSPAAGAAAAQNTAPPPVRPRTDQGRSIAGPRGTTYAEGANRRGQRRVPGEQPLGPLGPNVANEDFREARDFHRFW